MHNKRHMMRIEIEKGCASAVETEHSVALHWIKFQNIRSRNVIWIRYSMGLVEVEHVL